MRTVPEFLEHPVLVHPVDAAAALAAADGACKHVPGGRGDHVVEAFQTVFVNRNERLGRSDDAVFYRQPRDVRNPKQQQAAVVLQRKPADLFARIDDLAPVALEAVQRAAVDIGPVEAPFALVPEGIFAQGVVGLRQDVHNHLALE